ncbi:rCG56147 [Rattus norvegicus]|uniref:RCG56147 n=1 Tax=Rattus norvegicus TaxID=10116 RepID=A6IBE4_RAT|nr:rCG56147 [Rattus norvegicus]
MAGLSLLLSALLCPPSPSSVLKALLVYISTHLPLPLLQTFTPSFPPCHMIFHDRWPYWLFGKFENPAINN